MSKSVVISVSGITDPHGTLESQKALITSMGQVMESQGIKIESDEAKAAWERLVEGENQGQVNMAKAAASFDKKRAKELELADKGEKPIPIILGQTVSNCGRIAVGYPQLIGIAA